MFKILIVDDDKDTTELISVLLEQRGYGVRVLETRAGDVERVIDQFMPDTILLDYVMSGMSAEAFVTLVRTKYPRIQFVLMTGLVETATPVADRLGIPLLAKPFDPETLYEIVDRVTGSGEHISI